MTRHLNALDGQLVIHAAAHAHQRQVRRALPLPKAELRGIGHEPGKGDVGAVRRIRRLIGSMLHVVEQRARLDHHGQRLLARIIPQRDCLVVQVRQKRIGTIEMEPAFQLLEQLAQSRVRARGALEGFYGARLHGRGGQVLAHGIDFDFVERRDALARRGHDAPDLVELVPEEVEPHRIRQVAGKDVDDSAANAERTGTLELAGVLVASLLQNACHVAELGHVELLGARHICELAACHERERLVNALGQGRKRAQQRPRRGHDDDRRRRRKGVRRLHPARHLARVWFFRTPWRIASLGEVQHALIAHIGGDVARKRVGSFLARHHDQRRLRLMRETRGDHERPRR